jgi:AraC-like DNA-binding protein
MDLRIEKLVALMRDDPTQRLPLSKMAQLVNLSRARLCYLFKSESGISASLYLKSLRMKEAAVLLSTTFLSVKEIMVRVGLGDESHFVKDFKKIYGMTPTEYRKSKAAGNGHGSVLEAIETGLSVSVSREIATSPGEYFDRRALPRDAAKRNVKRATDREWRQLNRSMRTRS